MNESLIHYLIESALAVALAIIEKRGRVKKRKRKLKTT